MGALLTEQRMESSGFAVLKVAGSPIEALGDEACVVCYFHVYLIDAYFHFEICILSS